MTRILKPLARRTVLRALLAAGPVLLGFAPRLGWTKPPPKGKHDMAVAAALTMQGDAEAARAVGRAYLSAYPSERRQSIIAGLEGAAARTGKLRGETFFDALKRASRADFAAGETVEVEGWILSRTEARVYALAAGV